MMETASEVSRSGTAKYTDCSIINWENERQNAFAANDKSKFEALLFWFCTLAFLQPMTQRF